MNNERNHAIDQYSSYGPLKALTPEEVIKAIAKVLEENANGELGVIYVYTQLCAHPARYGFESENQLPLMPDFAAICTGRFPSRKEVNKIFIRPARIFGRNEVQWRRKTIFIRGGLF